MIQLILDAANDAIDKEELIRARKDLAERIDDWKTLKLDNFGDLIRYGTYIVAKNEAKEPEREVCTVSILR